MTESQGYLLADPYGEIDRLRHRCERWKTAAKRLYRRRLVDYGRDFCEGCGRLVPEDGDGNPLGMLWEDGIRTCPECSPTQEELALMAAGEDIP